MNKTYEILIGKELTKGASVIPVVNPFTGEPFAEVCLADSVEIDKAINLAEKAFKKTKNEKIYTFYNNRLIYFTEFFTEQWHNLSSCYLQP